jgi:proteasome lid subunit RPN8/RPN11
VLTEQHRIIIAKHAKNEYPRECCGLITKSGHCVPCENISVKPETHFVISQEEKKQVIEDFGELWGYYHSHPNGGDLSEKDKWIAAKLQINCILYSENQIKIHSPGIFDVPYLGRPFVLGILDCLTLVIDYYRRELNIRIEDFEHPSRCVENWDNLPVNFAGNLYLSNFFINQGFVRVDKPKRHDILLNYWGLKAPSHCLIYLRDNLVMHHPPGLDSKTEEYAKIKKRTSVILRHKTLA